jgi:hypothetical protein
VAAALLPQCPVQHGALHSALLFAKPVQVKSAALSFTTSWPKGEKDWHSSLSHLRLQQSCGVQLRLAHLSSAVSLL